MKRPKRPTKREPGPMLLVGADDEPYLAMADASKSSWPTWKVRHLLGQRFPDPCVPGHDELRESLHAAAEMKNGLAFVMGSTIDEESGSFFVNETPGFYRRCNRIANACRIVVD